MVLGAKMKLTRAALTHVGKGNAEAGKTFYTSNRDQNLNA